MSTHRILASLLKGDEIPGALIRLVRERHVRAGEIRALGILSRAELLHYDTYNRGFRDPRVFERDIEILLLWGTIAERDGEPWLHLHLTGSYETESGIVVVGGHLQRARVHSCEVVLDPWEHATVGANRQDPASAPSPSRAAPVSRSVPEARSDPLAALERPLAPPPRVERESYSDEIPLPQPGDVIEHPHFGRCTLEQVDEDDRLLVRLPAGRLVQLGLGVLRLHAPREEAGRRVFPVEVRHRRR